MRLIIDNLHHKKLLGLTNGIEISKEVIMLYTPNGIFIEESGKYYNVIPEDSPGKYISYQKMDMILDFTILHRKEEVFSVMNDKYSLTTCERYYNIYQDIYIVTKIVDENVIDIYFYSTNENELYVVQSVYDIIVNNHIECGIII